MILGRVAAVFFAMLFIAVAAMWFVAVAAGLSFGTTMFGWVIFFGVFVGSIAGGVSAAVLWEDMEKKQRNKR